MYKGFNKKHQTGYSLENKSYEVLIMLNLKTNIIWKGVAGLNLELYQSTVLQTEWWQLSLFLRRAKLG